MTTSISPLNPALIAQQETAALSYNEAAELVERVDTVGSPALFGGLTIYASLKDTKERLPFYVLVPLVLCLPATLRPILVKHLPNELTHLVLTYLFLERIQQKEAGLASYTSLVLLNPLLRNISISMRVDPSVSIKPGIQAAERIPFETHPNNGSVTWEFAITTTLIGPYTAPGTRKRLVFDLSSATERALVCLSILDSKELRVSEGGKGTWFRLPCIHDLALMGKIALLQFFLPPSKERDQAIVALNAIQKANWASVCTHYFWQSAGVPTQVSIR